MSPHFPVLKPKEIIKLLETKGFELKKVTGSHHIFYHPNNGVIVPVPIHGNKPLKIGTLRSILKMADVTLDELKFFMKS